MALTLNRTLKGVNFVDKFEYGESKPRLLSDYLRRTGLEIEEVGRVLKLHSREVELLRQPDAYICQYAEDNLIDYLEARRAVEEFMRHQHGFQNPEDVAETGQRMPLEAVVCDLGLVEMNA